MLSGRITSSGLAALMEGLAHEENYVFLETTAISPDEHRSLLFIRPRGRICCRSGDDPADFFRQAEDMLRKGHYLAGWMAYDFGYLLEPVLLNLLTKLVPPGTIIADFGVFDSPYIYEHRTAAFIGLSGSWPFPPVKPDEHFHPETPYRVENLKISQEKSRYVANINKIKRYIENGDTYQVNYTLKLLFDFSGRPESLYPDLRRNQSVSYAAIIKNGPRHTLSLSPELFFRKTGMSCVVKPMKGTCRRGKTNQQDRSLAEELRSDVKNRSENIMIVDLLRNDLGRLCQPGTVQTSSLFEVERYETLHQMTSTVRGTLKPSVALRDLFHALFPSGSVTGAPKIRTMEIIAELEGEMRGVYTGAIGYISPGGDAVLNVPIRTVVIENGKGIMGIGSGIVYDSDPHNEWRECMLKSRFLTDPTPKFELFETILWLRDTGYWLLDLHLERLADSAEYFLFPFSKYEAEQLLGDTQNKLAAQEKTAQRIRLTLSKEGELQAEVFPLPETAANPSITVNSEPVSTKDLPTAVWSEKTTESASPFLYHKTTLRSLYNEERKRIAGNGHLEVLFTNELGEATEGSITNLFVLKGGILQTPPLRCGLLNGILRRHLLGTAKTGIIERVLSKKDVANADAVYVGNSVRGLIQVQLVD